VKEIKVGLIGLGTVGTGVARILLEQGDLLEKKLGARLVLKKIADLDVARDRGISLPPGIMTPKPEDVLHDSEIPIIMELMGGIEPARSLILKAFSLGKHVVTANKALLAEHGAELYSAAKERGVDLLFEGSVAGGIPIIRVLKEGLAANRIHYICGILNGTCNYILTRMTEGNGDFDQVLKEAQSMGYAEADPTLDIEAHDTAHKLAILLALSQGTHVSLSDIYTEGITKITPLDIQFARELGYRIKLLGIIRSIGDEVEARVHPTMIPEEHILSSVNGAFNALQILGDSVGSILLCGLGAGMMPTASAVVGDVMELARNILKGICQRVPELAFQPQYVGYKKIRPIESLACAYYFRFTALDRPGVLSKITGILGEHDISLASVIQKARRAGQGVPVVMMTHVAREADVQKALKRLDQLDVLPEKTMMIRVEERDNAEMITGGAS
jgi:homoserine dehydrogenase